MGKLQFDYVMRKFSRSATENSVTLQVQILQRNRSFTPLEQIKKSYMHTYHLQNFSLSAYIQL